MNNIIIVYLFLLQLKSELKGYNIILKININNKYCSYIINIIIILFR